MTSGVYANDKPNVDLAAGHLLYGLGWGYDLLYRDLSEQERARYRDKLIKQARLLADYFKPKSGRTFAYSQNHVFIPITGLGVAAYALYGETPEAAEWAKLARAFYDRVLATLFAGRLLLRRVRILDLRDALAGPLPRRAGACSGRGLVRPSGFS